MTNGAKTVAGGLVSPATLAGGLPTPTPLASAEFAALLQEVYLARDEELRATYSRSLPFADARFDRWERAKRLGFGTGASIYDSSCVFGDVRVGDGTWIGPNTLLDGSGGMLEIGATCSISAGVHIYTHDTVHWAISGGIAPARKAPVRIGDRCYIGPQSIIVAGVTIGRKCIVGANSFVAVAVPDATFVAGSPARVVGRIEGEGADVRIVRSGV